MLGALLLSSCLGGSGDASPQASQLLEVVRALKGQLDELKANQAALTQKIAALEEHGGSSGVAAPSGGGFPDLLPEEQLTATLEQAALEKRREVTAALKAKGLEVTSYGNPEIIMPVEFTHPYKAEVPVTINQGGRQFTTPLTFRADWQGQWKVEDTEALVQTIIASARSGQTTSPEGTPAPRFGGGSVANNPSNQPAAQQPPTQPPPQQPPSRPAQTGPNVPGANVREIDLTGKELFNR